MLFNSLEFFIFLPIVLGSYFSLSFVGRQVLLVAASFIFYMYWSVPYAGIILFFIFADYFAGRWIANAHSQQGKKAGLIFSLVCNLSVLFVFKYFDFFTGALHQV